MALVFLKDAFRNLEFSGAKGKSLFYVKKRGMKGRNNARMQNKHEESLKSEECAKKHLKSTDSPQPL